MKIALALLAGCGHGFFDPQPKCDGGGSDSGSAGPPIMYKQSSFASSMSGQTNFGSTQLPLPVADGDLIVVVIAWTSGGGATISALIDSLQNTYSLAAGPTTGVASLSEAVFVAHSVAAAAGQLEVQVSLSQGALLRMAMVEYANADIANPVDTAQSSTGATGTAVSAGPVTTTHAHDLLFAAGFNDTAWNPQLPGYSTRATGSDFTTQDLEVDVTGTYNPMAGTANNWIMQMVALRGL